MTSLWRLLANLNFLALYFFWTAPFERVATRFDMTGSPVAWVTREQHVYFMAGLMIFMNLVFFFVYRWSFRVTFLDYANFPNRNYWLASPDRRLDAVVRMRTLMSTVGVFINVIFAQLQIFLYLANFYQKAFTPKILYVFMGAVAAILVGLGVWVRSLFLPDVE